MCAGLRHGQGPRPKKIEDLLLSQAAMFHEQEVLDQHAFLMDAPAVRRGRKPGVRPPIIRMVSPGRQQRKQAPRSPSWNTGEITVTSGRCVAAVIRSVEDVGVPRAHPLLAVPDHGSNRLAHGAEMHRHMWRVRDKAPFGIEERTREVQPFLHVDGIRGVLNLWRPSALPRR